MRQVYVSDTNIWIDLRNAGLLDAIFQLPITLCCTDFVLNELHDFDHKALAQQGLRVKTLAAQIMPRLLVLKAKHNNSSLADVSCYLLAQEAGCPLLTGDGRLRKQALHDGIDVHGALWLLDQLVVHAVISPMRAATGLQDMLTSGARLPRTECHDRLVKWNV